MDIFQLENLRIELQNALYKEKSPLVQISLLNKYFLHIIDQDDSSITEAFITEFIQPYLASLKNFCAVGIDPEKLEKEITIVNKIVQLSAFNDYYSEFTNEVNRINKGIKIVKNSLSGNETDFQTYLLSFPVNIKSENENINIGQIETFNIKIHEDDSLNNNQFIIVPSIKEIDKQLDEQIKASWDFAVNYLKKYYKTPSKFHEVVIIFNRKFAQFEGFSLGFAITIGFIQALFKHYNTSLSLSLNSNIALTGGFDFDKKIKNIVEKIIKQKTETVFFSPYNYFVMPDKDAIAAKEKLSELKIRYPERKLKIINIEDFDDLINYRQIINIEKAKITERTEKFIKKNKYTLLLSSILLTILSFLAIYSIDNNPKEFRIVNHTVNIVNRHGKILWSTKQKFSNKKKLAAGGELLLGVDEKYVQLLYDIDKDGINEVILAQEFSDGKDNSKDKSRRITCYNNFGEEIWTYLFSDTISTKNEIFDPKDYNNSILGIVEEKDKTVLLGVSRQLYFPSAIYKLDIKTGQRLEGTLWSQGHFNWRGSVGDFNNDGKTEIFIGGISNAMESAFVLYVDYDSLNGQTPNKKVQFNNHPIANIGHYILIGKTDVANYLNLRFNNITSSSYSERTDDFCVNSFEGMIKQSIGLVYRFSKDFSQVKTQIGDDLQFIRDSLVIKGELKPPLTNNPEYSNILLSGIKEWNGKEFVQFPALKDKKKKK